MSIYRVESRWYNTVMLQSASSASKAKYAAYKRLEEWFVDFEDFLQLLKGCRKLNPQKKEDFFLGSKEDYQRIVDARGINNAELGTEVYVCGSKGFIIGANRSMRLNVFSYKDEEVIDCHPHHEIVYFNKDGSVMYDFRSPTVVV